MLSRRAFLISTALTTAVSPFALNAGFAADIAVDEARALAKEATIYGFPLVDNYRVQHS